MNIEFTNFENFGDKHLLISFSESFTEFGGGSFNNKNKFYFSFLLSYYYWFLGSICVFKSKKMDIQDFLFLGVLFFWIDINSSLSSQKSSNKCCRSLVDFLHLHGNLSISRNKKHLIRSSKKASKVQVYLCWKLIISPSP